MPIDQQLQEAIQRHLEYTDATRRSAALADLYDAAAPYCKTEADWQRLAAYILERRREWEKVTK